MKLQVDIHKTLHAGPRRFDLHVAFACERQRVVLLGASGSGKSLTLQGVAGLLRPDRGHVRLQGRTLFDSAQSIDLPPQARRLGYLFQDYALFPHLTVRQNVAFGCSRGWFNPHPDNLDSTVERWLDALELRPLARQRPEALSGGQRQRVALARTLAAGPQALLLDEPFAALDCDLRERMRQVLDDVQRDIRLPMLLITHDPADAERFGDQVVRLEAGRVGDVLVRGRPECTS